MTPDFDEQTRATLASAQEALATAQNGADNFAQAKLHPASARVSASHESRSRLGSPPAPESYANAADWREAADRYTFAERHHARDLAEAERRFADAQAEHARLLAPLPAMRLELWRLGLAGLDSIVAARLQEAADVATLRQSLIVRVPMEHWPVLNPAHEGRNPAYIVKSGGFPDVSFVNPTVQTDGFTADKSAALVAELGLTF